MAEAVVDGLEVIDVDHAQPVARPGRVAAFAVVQLGVEQRQRRDLVEAVVEDLAIEQAREGVALAVVEQGLHVAIDAQHAEDQAARLGADAAGALQLDHADGAGVGDDREQCRDELAFARLDDLGGGQALEPGRAVCRLGQRVQVDPGRIGRGSR
jgi:hypothetical protein